MPSGHVQHPSDARYGECATFLLDSQFFSQARYASIVVDGELRFYCVPHFKELFKRHADYTHGFRSDVTVESDPNLKVVAEEKKE